MACIPAELCEVATAALLAYRTHCAASSAAGQLILPEALKLLPLYVSCMTRLAAFAHRYAPRLLPAPPPESWPAGEPWPARLGGTGWWPPC